MNILNRKPVYFRPMRKGDYVLIETEEFPKEILEEIEKDRLDDDVAVSAFTPLGDIIGCYGMFLLWDKVGCVWANFDRVLAPKYGREIVLYTRRIFYKWWDMFELHRMQADVLANSKVNKRFIEHFGFHLEGTMEKYDPYGRDFCRYARLR